MRRTERGEVSADAHDGNGGRARADDRTRARTELTLESIGITLIGVVVGIGVTVGFGVSTLPVALRVVAGGGTAIVLLLLVKLATTEHGVLRRLARWITSIDVE